MGFSIKAEARAKDVFVQIYLQCCHIRCYSGQFERVRLQQLQRSGTFSSPVSGIGSGGKFLNTDLDLESGWAASPPTLKFTPTANDRGCFYNVGVAAGATMYFKVVATVTGVGSGDSMTVTLRGDSALSFIGRFDGQLSTLKPPLRPPTTLSGRREPQQRQIQSTTAIDKRLQCSDIARWRSNILQVPIITILCPIIG